MAPVGATLWFQKVRPGRTLHLGSGSAGTRCGTKQLLQRHVDLRHEVLRGGGVGVVEVDLDAGG